jgi:hypothetical protein
MEAVTLTLSIVSLCFSLFTWYRALIHDRKKDTLDAFNVLQQQALDPLQSYTRARIREIAGDARSEEYRIVSTYLARIEHFCVGVEQKVYDQRTVWELSEGFLNRGVYEKLKPIIEHKNQQKNYYRNFLAVVEKMNREEM